MESWKHAWRKGFAPQLSTAGLVALAAALEGDDRRLLQGATTSPPPVPLVLDWPPEAACPAALCGWLGDGLETVGELEEYFATVCRDADLALGGNAACRWFLNWADETPRGQMRAALLLEVKRELRRRQVDNEHSAE